MSLTEDFCVDVEVEDIEITIDKETPEVDVIITSSPDVIILAAANIGGEGATGPQGPAGATGPVGPAGPAGADGADGADGAPGTPGSAGTPGEKWFSGSGAPSGATGVVGDWYLNTANGDVYEKTGSSTWTLRANIMGPAGSSVASGVSSTATGDVAATNVQAAIAELASEKQAVSAKGAANGYAPLDASSKVPTANLPATFTIVDAAEDLIVGSANDAVKRLAKGTDGQILKVASGVLAWGDPPSGGSVVTSLPGSPTDGQEIVYLNSLTAPTYAWRFRYVASITDAYKWVFIGGSPYSGYNGTADNSIASTSYTDPTNNVSLTTPLAGIWNIEAYCLARKNTAQDANVYFTLSIGGTDQTALEVMHYAQDKVLYTAETIRTITSALAASTVIKWRVRNDGSATTSIDNKFIALLPVRVG